MGRIEDLEKELKRLRAKRDKKKKKKRSPITDFFRPRGNEEESLEFLKGL